MKTFSISILIATLCLFAGFKTEAAENNDKAVPRMWGSLYSPTSGLFTNLVRPGGVSNTLTRTDATCIRVVPGYRLTIFPSISATQASTSNMIYKFKQSVDLQFWTTNFTHSVTQVFTGTATNMVAIDVGTNFQGRFLSLDALVSEELGTTSVSRVQFTWTPGVPR